MNASPKPTRILVVDDNPSIHKDIRQILNPEDTEAGLDDLETAIFGEPQLKAQELLSLEIDSATQGEDGYELVRQAIIEDHPYFMAIVDMRMPPGWNGLKTVENMFRADNLLQVVICTAYSDHTLNEIRSRLGDNDRVLLLKKPFENIELRQMVFNLRRKWEERFSVQQQIDRLNNKVHHLNTELERLNSRVANTLTDQTVQGIPDAIAQEIAENTQNIDKNNLNLEASVKSLNEVFVRYQKFTETHHPELKQSAEIQAFEKDLTSEVENLQKTLADSSRRIENILKIPQIMSKIVKH